MLIENEETGGKRLLSTAGDGTFSAPSIPVGYYTAVVLREGYAPLKRMHVELTVGQNIHLHLTVKVGTVEQSVSVADTPVSVDESILQSEGLVNERQVKELPLNGRASTSYCN